MAESGGKMACIDDTESDDDVGAASNAAGGEKQKAPTLSPNTDKLDAKKHERMQKNKHYAQKSRDNSKKHRLFLERQVAVLSKQHGVVGDGEKPNVDAKQHESMQRNKLSANKSRDNSEKYMQFLEQQIAVLSKQTHILHLRLEHIENKLIWEASAGAVLG